MWSYFDLKVILNVPSATERWKQTVHELHRIGITDYVKFEAIPDIGPHQSFNRSVNTILCTFLASDKKRLLLFEDDVQFINNDWVLRNCLPDALYQLPPYWDILYLGANIQEKEFEQPVYYSPNLCKVTQAWTTHAVAFNKKCVQYLIDNQPDFSERMFDNWLSSELKNLNAFCIYPMLATQRPGQSLIWGNLVNYDRVFTRSNELLNKTK